MWLESSSDHLPFAGKDTVKVSASGTEAYKVSFVPTFSGVHTGTITFTNMETGCYVWFSLECRVSDPPQVGAIEVEAVVRTAVEIQVRDYFEVAGLVDRRVVICRRIPMYGGLKSSHMRTQSVADRVPVSAYRTFPECQAAALAQRFLACCTITGMAEQSVLLSRSAGAGSVLASGWLLSGRKRSAQTVMFACRSL